MLALTGTGLVLRQDDEPRPHLGGQAHCEPGGPKFKYTYLDHKSGDAAAGVQAMTELVQEVQASSARTSTTSGPCCRRRPSTRCSLSTAAAAPASSVRPSRTSGVPGPSRPAYRCRACSSGPKATLTPRRWGFVLWDLGAVEQEKIQDGLPGEESRPPATPTTSCTSSSRSGARTLRCRRRSSRTSRSPSVTGIYGQDPGSFAERGRHRFGGVRVGFEVHARRPHASKGTYDWTANTFSEDYFDARKTR